MPGAAFSWHYAVVEHDNCCYQALARDIQAVMTSTRCLKFDCEPLATAQFEEERDHVELTAMQNA
jgi:hypothetical protein